MFIPEVVEQTASHFEAKKLSLFSKDIVEIFREREFTPCTDAYKHGSKAFKAVGADT